MLKRQIILSVFLCIICASYLIRDNIKYEKAMKMQEIKQQQEWQKEIDKLYEEFQEETEPAINLNKIKQRLI